jgi:hypothetical protein
MTLKIRENLLEPEINSNGRDITLLKTVVSEPFKDGRLAHTRWPNDHELEHIVVTLLHKAYIFFIGNSDFALLLILIPFIRLVPCSFIMLRKVKSK